MLHFNEKAGVLQTYKAKKKSFLHQESISNCPFAVISENCFILQWLYDFAAKIINSFIQQVRWMKIKEGTFVNYLQDIGKRSINIRR